MPAKISKSWSSLHLYSQRVKSTDCDDRDWSCRL